MGKNDVKGNATNLLVSCPEKSLHFNLCNFFIGRVTYQLVYYPTVLLPFLLSPFPFPILSYHFLFNFPFLSRYE